MIYDVTIIGAGLVGLSTAHQLLEQRPDLKICVVEKESAVAQHQSKNNSGVMHSGIYYTPGSLKAHNCTTGHAQLVSFCREHGVPFELCGKIIVATKEKEIPTLHAIREKGIKNGLQGLDLLSRDQAREIEPHVECIQAINVPQAGIVEFEAVAKKYAELFTLGGGTILLNHEVKHIISTQDQVTVVTTDNEVQTKYLITCAGLYADHIGSQSHPDLKIKILPFRGEYYELKAESAHLVRHLIYPVPDVSFPFLGVHFTRRMNGGKIEAGPNAVLAFSREGYHHNQVNGKELREILGFSGFQKLAGKYWKTGLQEMRRSYSKRLFVKAMQELIPEITMDAVVRGRSGVRAMACDPQGNLVEDFLILESEKVIDVLNAPSPAATASLAIGKEVLKKILKKIN
ncbi:UNVERIFIED_CONTAM: hypothetical protein GTU68_060618 [Idotea baltica]|nr:hypothetical protein [Idotea baltica]